MEKRRTTRKQLKEREGSETEKRSRKEHPDEAAEPTYGNRRKADQRREHGR
jgi:hypothetical protein